SAMKKSNTTILAAALALPGVVPSAYAQVTVPNAPLIQFKYLYYRDYQDSGDRITVKSPALYLLAPISDSWVFEIGAVYDNVSGASPYYHTVLSGASGQGITDGRIQGDFTVTKYFGRTSVSARAAVSNEDDYRSYAGGLTVRHATPDQNTTFTAGAGYSNDRVFPSDGPQFTRNKSTIDGIVGITQVLSRNDVAQLNFYYAVQRGYLTDPYKALYGIDQRPDRRDQMAGVVRLNHYFDRIRATARLSYRYYHDNWEINAHTGSLEWAQELPYGFTLTPSVRYTTQSAAYFYYDPVYDAALGPPFPPGYAQNPNAFYSADQRLAAFGGISPGIKLQKDFTGGWSVDGKAEYYEQRADWRVGGDGSPGLQDFKAQLYQVGVSKKF
ncbi:MAG: DUF3570 domain-containing protein, partial [Burkholderiaceae bacterium]